MTAIEIDRTLHQLETEIGKDFVDELLAKRFKERFHGRPLLVHFVGRRAVRLATGVDLGIDVPGLPANAVASTVALPFDVFRDDFAVRVQLPLHRVEEVGRALGAGQHVSVFCFQKQVAGQLRWAVATLIHAIEN